MAVRFAVLVFQLWNAAASSLSSDKAPSFLFMLADDIGWADMGYNGGVANTPNIDKWSASAGTIRMMDFHSGGTVCSPTRASVLTGRTPMRDCVDGVYGCSDMTECVPSFNFAPQRAFTTADAARAAGKGHTSWFSGKWHLGSFYNDSEALGGVWSSPIRHGFDHMNATVEVAPTGWTNCQCNAAWEDQCFFGHNKPGTHCQGKHDGPVPGQHCCFNYWREDSNSSHGVSSMTHPSFLLGGDDSLFLATAFVDFIGRLGGKPFAAQISFHNCHIPYVGTKERRAACLANQTCNATRAPNLPYSEAQLDFYACLTELDNSVGIVLKALDDLGYRKNTMIWFTTDNGPEGNCQPEGRCTGDHFGKYPGSAGQLRGRKRDTWEGGHRVPGIISWPAVVGKNRESWDMVVTSDFLPTMIDVLGVERPSPQRHWGMDGKSILPLLRGEDWPDRGMGWLFSGYSNAAFRYGKWKYVHGTRSCGKKNKDCQSPMLFDLDADLGETMDLAKKLPDVLADISRNFSLWQASVKHSIQAENLNCSHPIPPPGPSPGPRPTTCTFSNDTGLMGLDLRKVSAKTKEACCQHCVASDDCHGADFHEGTCHVKSKYSPKVRHDGSIAVKPASMEISI